MQVSQENNNSVPCIPWFIPTPSNLTVYFCNPWEAVTFLDFMNQVPGDVCQCLPDCSATLYEPHITSTPLRRCDSGNFGISRLCKHNFEMFLQPSMYGNQVRTEFIVKNAQTPLLNLLESSTRNYTYELMFEQNPQTYDAFDKDIAVLEIFFRKPTILQMRRKARMTWIDFFSAIGGLLGLVLGTGIISFVELLWVCLRLTALKMNLQNLIP